MDVAITKCVILGFVSFINIWFRILQRCCPNWNYVKVVKRCIILGMIQKPAKNVEIEENRTKKRKKSRLFYVPNPDVNSKDP
jgi:hypothetical protein